jgi:hypothetical protein
MRRIDNDNLDKAANLASENADFAGGKRQSGQDCDEAELSNCHKRDKTSDRAGLSRLVKERA